MSFAADMSVPVVFFRLAMGSVSVGAGKSKEQVSRAG